MAGHTITLVGDDIYIIGGYDRVRGFSERSYKYNVITKVWANLTTSGPSPKGWYRPWWWLFRGPVIIYRMGGGGEILGGIGAEGDQSSPMRTGEMNHKNIVLQSFMGGSGEILSLYKRNAPHPPHPSPFPSVFH